MKLSRLQQKLETFSTPETKDGVQACIIIIKIMYVYRGVSTEEQQHSKLVFWVYLCLPSPQI